MCPPVTPPRVCRSSIPKLDIYKVGGPIFWVCVGLYLLGEMNGDRIRKEQEMEKRRIRQSINPSLVVPPNKSNATYEQLVDGVCNSDDVNTRSLCSN